MIDENHCDDCWEAWLYGDPDPHRWAERLKVAAVVVVAAALVVAIGLAPSMWWAR